MSIEREFSQPTSECGRATIAINARNTTLNLGPEGDLGLYSPPGRDGWWIQSCHPPLVTGRGELYHGRADQLADGVLMAFDMMPVSPALLEREFASPAEAAAFVRARVASPLRRVMEEARCAFGGGATLG